MSSDTDNMRAENAQLKQALEQANVATAVLRQQREAANDAAARFQMTLELQARELAAAQQQLAALKTPKTPVSPKADVAVKRVTN